MINKIFTKIKNISRSDSASFGVTLTGCQVHFDRDAVTFGKVESKKKKGTKKKVVKPKKTNQRVSNKTEIHNKVNKK